MYPYPPPPPPPQQQQQQQYPPPPPQQGYSGYQYPPPLPPVGGYDPSQMQQQQQQQQQQLGYTPPPASVPYPYQQQPSQPQPQQDYYGHNYGSPYTYPPPPPLQYSSQAYPQQPLPPQVPAPSPAPQSSSTSLYSHLMPEAPGAPSSHYTDSSYAPAAPTYPLQQGGYPVGAGGVVSSPSPPQAPVPLQQQQQPTLQYQQQQQKQQVSHHLPQQFTLAQSTSTSSNSQDVLRALSLENDFDIPTQVPANRFQTVSRSGRILKVYICPKEKLWMRLGAMIAYNGSVAFAREGVFEHGLGNAIKEGLTSESMDLVKATCKTSENAVLYCAHEGKKCIPLYLQAGESVSVNGEDVLAFEGTCRWSIKLVKKMAGIRSGGLFNVEITGPGHVCIMSSHDPLVLRVSNNCPVRTDPDNTIAWSTNLRINFRTDLPLFRMAIAGSSGEETQMEFVGEGFVIVDSALNAYQQKKKDEEAERARAQQR